MDSARKADPRTVDFTGEQMGELLSVLFYAVQAEDCGAAIPTYAFKLINRLDEDRCGVDRCVNKAPDPKDFASCFYQGPCQT